MEAYKTMTDDDTTQISPESEATFASAFSDKAIRRGFIRKVYAILMAQLVMTSAVIAFFMYYKPSQDFLREQPYLITVSWVASFVVMIAISCFETLRRAAPWNFILLSVFTLTMSFTLGFTAVVYKSEEILLAAGLTAVVCFSLTVFAFQTKWDFTVLGGTLFVALIIFFIFGIFSIIFQNYVMKMLYASLGALLFSVYLIYDTQVIIGGNHKYSISPEEYIFAALSLYLDIINIFLYILRLVRH